MALKCKINAKDKLFPIEGEGTEGKGTCPECLTPDRKLTGKGFLGAHIIVLDVDTTIPVTDEGLRIGAPRDAAIKRELEGRKISAGRAEVPSADMEDRASVHRGPTLVRGRDEGTRLRDPGLPWEESTDLRQDGSVRKSTTLDQPLGRPRFDRMITDVLAPARRRTPAERNRHRKAQRLALRLAQGK